MKLRTLEKRYVTNVIVVTLELSSLEKHFLINTEVLKKVNHSTTLILFGGSVGSTLENIRK